MTHALTEAFIDLINSGQVDGDLETIENAVRLRAHHVNFLAGPPGRSYPPFGQPYQPIGGGFNVGDRVITGTNISPKYLQGRPGTLIRLKMKRWAFKPDDPSVWVRFLHPDGTTGLLPSQFRKETP